MKTNNASKKIAPNLLGICIVVIASLLLIVPIALAALNYGGSEQTYNSENTVNNSVAKLDINKFVVAYQDNDSLGKAVVCTVSGSTISCGSEYSFGITGGTGDLSITALDTTHFVVAHQSTLGAYGTSTIGTVSGTTISYGSNYTFNATNTVNISTDLIDTNKFVVAYKDSDSLGKAIIGTVSGTVISYSGAEASFGITGGTGDVSVSTLDTTHFVVAHESTLGAYGTATVGTVSGSLISYGSNYTFNGANTSNISTDLVDINKFVIAYRDSDSLGKAIIGTVSGTTISYGSEASFGITGGTGSLHASTLDSNRFVVAHQSTLGAYGTSTTGNVSGSTIAYGSNYTFNSQNTDHIATTKIDTDKFVIAYRDAGDSPANYGKAIVGEYQEEAGVIPELPKNNLWKLLVAVLALGLVVGIAFWRKKKIPQEPEKK